MRLQDVHDLCRAIDADGLLPSHYAAYKPLLTEGLAFFLQRLSPNRQNAILTEQAALPAEASAAARLVGLMQACPTLHKLGQVVARHRHLEADLRSRLQVLESMSADGDWGLVWPVLERELAEPIANSDIRLEQRALAQASVAVVVPASVRGEGGRPIAAVAKVLRSGVAEMLRDELDVLRDLATFLDHRAADHGLPKLDYRETFDTVVDLLAHEVRLDQEQAHLAEAKRWFAGVRDVVVPEVLPGSTPRVTVMTRVEGVKVTEVGDLAPRKRKALAETIIDALIARSALNAGDGGLFHADPHAGNLLRTPDGRLGVLDWALVGRLNKPTLVKISQLVMGALTLDVPRCADAVVGLTGGTARLEAVRHGLHGALGAIRRGGLPGPTWLIGLLDDLVLAGCRFSADLVLLRKSLLTLDGVVRDVSPEVSLDAVLVAAAAKAFAAEWPRRATALPYSRDFATHLSNADLLQFSAAGPMTMTNFWMQTWRDWLG